MVYVIQKQKDKDISSAAEYGELVPLLPEGAQITFSAGHVAGKLKVELSGFCDDDYLLLIGDPVAIGLAVACAALWNRGRVKMLKWDRIAGKYFPVQADLYRKGTDGLTE